jgi:hypothetical protein
MENELFRAFIDAGVEAGYDYNPDINGENQVTQTLNPKP